MRAFLGRHEEHAAVINRVLDGTGSPDDERMFDELHKLCRHCRAEMLNVGGLTEAEFEAYATSPISRTRFLSAVTAYDHAHSLVDVDVVGAAMVVMQVAGPSLGFSTSEELGSMTRHTVMGTCEPASSPTQSGDCNAS